MVQTGKSNYTELVYEVLRSADGPLTFQQIFDEVGRRQPVVTRNPKGTIRNVLNQSKQLVGLGDGRYGYLPSLLKGSLFRLPFTEKKPANVPLFYTEETRLALWPSFHEIAKRRNPRPAHVRIPTGDEVELELGSSGPGIWGSQLPEALRGYLVENRAAAGDSLLFRVLDAEAGRYEARFERKRPRDEAKVAWRNGEMAEAAYAFLRGSPSVEVSLGDMVAALVARGLYRSDVAPDPLETVIDADPRFVNAGLGMWMLAENVTPETESLIRRRERLPELLKSLYEPEGKPEEIGPIPSRESMERIMRDAAAALSEKQFGSTEEANAYIQEALAGGGLTHRPPASAVEEAQEVMYDAWEAAGAERVRLAKKALKISPDCADAYVLLAEETARTAQEARDLYAKGVAAGERALGKETFEEDAGHFWGLIETRPYMRARAGLAQALWAMGRRGEAIDHVWEMLRLNPNDNQGMRDLLLAWLLETDDSAGVKRLLDLYPDDWSAVWLYGRALHAFRTEGDTRAARKLLAEAKKENPHVPAYLTGRKRMPKTLPQYISFGDESEAIACAYEQMPAWRNTPGALRWLEEYTR